LNDQDRAQLGLKSAPKEQTLGYGRSCRFIEVAARLVIDVGIFDELGLDKEIAGAKNRRPVPTVGNHQAQEYMFGSNCTFTMGVGAKSTVDASAGDIDGNDTRACEVAMKVAQLVEPKLP
jgi:hypothetical protein